MDGRLTVRVVDPRGQGVPAALALASGSLQFTANVLADAEGRAVLRRIPPGAYLLTVRHPGFETVERHIDLMSAVPRNVRVALAVATVQEEVTVRAAPPISAPYRPSHGTRAGRENLELALGTTLGRSTVDVVTAMPGWLLEANAVLHPRGSEYDTQYVIDGMPLYDNRSIAFAPAFENSEFEAVTVLTAGIPPEYGRRLGGVIALDSRRSAVAGNRTSLDLQAGAYANRIGALAHQYTQGGTEVAVGIHGGATERYLDPPSVENFTNRGSASGGNARVAGDLSSRQRLTGYARFNRTGFQVPNDLLQQATGQRQDRRLRESAGQVHYQSTLSSRMLMSVRGMLRDLASDLWSNELSTPTYVLHDRSFGEGVVMADLTLEGERHALKIGGDVRSADLRERFLAAEPDELPDFNIDFRETRRSTEASFYAYDQFRVGNFAASIGFRFDGYRLLISDRAFSPRLAASYFVPQISLQLYASYDRVFQPPPTENLLLSSAAAGLGVNAVESVLPVPANRAHFVELGISKTIGNAMRIDAKQYWRSFRNYIDDDVFLNTGVSFPITFDSAAIEGTEIRLEAPQWRGVSAVASYSNMLGRARSPVTGGLFVEGGEAVEFRDVADEIPISQDQRNTLAATGRFQIRPRVWFSLGIRYGSGLPVELDDDDDDDDHSEDEDAGAEFEAFPEAILRKVDFQRSRVLPNLSVDFSVGSRIWQRGSKSGTLQFDLRNIADRLNVINFSGLLSGTALAPGRQATVQLRVRF